MGKSIFLFLIFSQVYLYNCTIYSIDLVPINSFYEDYSQTFSYDNDQNDYLVIRGELEKYKKIYFNITSRNQISPYFYFSDYTYNSGEISKLIDYDFGEPSVSIQSRGLYYSYTFSASYSGDYYYYLYLAIHSNDKGTITFSLKTYYLSTAGKIASWLLTIIIIAGFICCAGLSMIIAKAMGKSPWEGLLCFCICCLIFCRK